MINKSEITDNELLERIKNSDKKAFTILYYRYFDMLYTLSLRYLKSEEIAQDAVQQTFMKVWEIRTHLEIKQSLYNYLYSITKNYILNQIRHNNTVIAHHYVLSQSQETIIEDIVENIEEKETFVLFYEALQKLPEKHREICLLKMEGEMTNEQIAQKLEVSVSTVKLLFKQAKDLLKNELTKILSIIIFFSLL